MTDLFVSPPKNENDPPQLVPEKLPETEKERKRIPGHTHNIFSSFCLYPEDIDFETREGDEKIILMVRKHIMTNFGWLAITVLLLFVPGVVKTFGILSILPAGYSFIAILIWYLVIMAYAFENFVDWYFDVYFITNMRIVDINFSNLINKHVSGAIVDKVQDVTYTTSGVFRTLFDFGDVFIQTAAEVSEFDFFAVPKPERVAKIIDDLKMKVKQKNHDV